MRIYINNIFNGKKEKVLGKNFEEKLKIEDIDLQKNKSVYNTRKGAVEIKKVDDGKRNKINVDSVDSKEDKEKVKKLPKSYYTLLTCMFLLAGFSIYLLKKSNDNLLEEDYAVFNNQTDDLNINEISNVNDVVVNLQSNKTSNIDTRQELEKDEVSSSTNVIAKAQQKVNTVIENKEEPLVFVKPLNGEISKIFSDDKVIYSKTLEMWKTHDGIDVKGKEGDIVYSIERGTVEKIYNDAFYGVTVVINHGQGYKSCYSNLSEDTFVKVGSKVKKSQKIGKIGTTSIGEIKDAPHLHFMLYKNNIVSDPSSIFK